MPTNDQQAASETAKAAQAARAVRLRGLISTLEAKRPPPRTPREFTDREAASEENKTRATGVSRDQGKIGE